MPISLAAATLVWTLVTPPTAPARSFEYQSAPVDFTARGVLVPGWTAVGVDMASLVCTSMATPRGDVRMTCAKAVANRALRYRVRACNGAGCSGWAAEAVLSCSALAGSGCPCGVLPSPVGCVP